MKSSWAYHNGLRELNRINHESKSPLRGWVEAGKIEAGYLYSYGERNKHNPKELVVKTYANKTQATKMLEQLKSEGVDCYLRLNYPFVIQCIDFSGWSFLNAH
jgi:hypothetical protein